MKMEKQRIVKGITDSYVVKEIINSMDGKPFLEVYEHVECNDDEVSEGYIGEWLCDINGTLSDTDEAILDAIDYELMP